ncbi:MULTISPECIES: SurA N-terminal domain-containing protein [unclassified Acinetobacter]|uniref:SurA N-terminal domain-containing protein n=1 Tax=unclassified Acinetobacter TaxID=196816 RepID=UPI0029341A0F|nr:MULTISPECIES: SurA N-terminal domain-containing protein [unclassified Acinetobacter]WOE31923.1 SurA N-terminal domain-containing protein [Acinetobacter sp. SAAs470]WOE37390.1 SurA N-terminal domain-containing protein [Acinetobacter sp. SAAs474]
MESFRKLIKGWLGKVLLVLFLTPLALVGIEGYFSGGQSKDTVETVNGQPISKKELETLTNSFKQQYLQYTQGDETLLNQTFLRDKALEVLVARTLLLEEAKKLGISLSDAQIKQMIEQQASFQQNGQFSQALYAQYLKSQGFPNSETFIANIRQDHALKMLSSTFLNYTLVSSSDLKQIIDLQTEQRTLHLASINLDKYKQNIKLTPEDIQNYYKKHTQLFKQLQNVDVDYIEVSPESMRSTNHLSVTDAELQQAYQKWVETQKAEAQPVVSHILVTEEGRTPEQAKKMIDTAYAELNQGASFAAVAQKYSEDPDSKNKGGTLSAYEKGFFGDAFDKTVASLKSGQVSQPVKTQFGYQIIQVTAPALQLPSLASKKAELTQQLIQTKSANAFADAVNGLNELVVANDALDVVSQEIKGSKIQSVKGFSLAAQHPVLSDPNVKVKLFNDDVKNGDRNASASIQLANGHVVWVKVRAYHPAGTQTLAEAMPRVKHKLIEEKALNAARADISKTLNAFKTEPAAKVLASTALRFENVGTLARESLKSEISKTAFSLSTPKPGMWSIATTSLPNELVVVGVSAVNHDAAKGLTAEQKQEVTRLYQELRGQQELDAYTQYLKSKAKIKKND